MVQVYYDLHIHTALSPCAGEDMTPCDIVGMAVLCGLDVIAITDHNALDNAKAVCDAARAAGVSYNMKDELIVLPGIEVTTSEEVHVLTLFTDTESAESFEKELSAYYSQIPNRVEIFGTQHICNSDGSVAGISDRMLIAPTTVSFETLYALTVKHNGAFVPAHVDRGSFSVLSNLGFLPPNLDIASVEYTSRSVFGETDNHDYSLFPGKKYIFSSDAHHLHVINEKEHYLNLPERSAQAVIDYLRFSH